MDVIPVNVNNFMKNYKFKINGKVQGVYYRACVQKSAFDSGYSGYVKNMSDGSVEAGVTCDESKIDNFINILEQGSTYSNVTSIEPLSCDELFSGGFEVR